MNKQTTITLSIFAILFVLALILCTHLLTKQSMTKDILDLNAKVISVQDTALAREREAAAIIRTTYDSAYAKLERQITTSLTKARSNKQYYALIPQKMAEVADSTARLSDDELRRAYAEFARYGR